MRTLSSRVLVSILSSGLLVATACGDDSAASSSSTSGSGGGGTTSGQGGAGEGGSTSNGPTTSTTTSTSSADGGGSTTSGPSGTGGAGGDTTSVSNGGAGPGAGTGGNGSGGGEPVCPAGTITCEGSLQRVCDGNGGFTETECAPGGCVDSVGCTVCQPDVGTCNGNISSVCKSDGSGFDVFTCDPIQGSTCDAGTGLCTGPCAPQLLGDSYIGCDYYPTVTLNSLLVNSFFSAEGTYAVAVSNTSADAVNVQVDRGGAAVTSTTVAGGSVAIVPLPWVYELKNTTTSQLLADGAYHLRSDRPVTVYQYNPIEYTTAFGNTYTNDASVLLPSNAWTGSYRVASRNSWYSVSGFYSVTASEDGTTVTLGPSATGTFVTGGGGVATDGTGTIVMNAGDVLQVVAGTDGNQSQVTDLTGSLISADKPVQVIGGHDCTNIPIGVGYCDHLEESMPPIETLATEYIVTPPQSAAGGADPEYVRVIATEANTTIAYDPPQAGAPTSLANAGDYFEIPATSADFVITGDKPILVAQYMRGQGDSGIPGDPAMALAVATEQYRDEYLFHAPTNYSSNFVNVTAPTGASIVLDGSAVGGFVAIGASGFSVARVQLSNAGDGNHTIVGSDSFGISVYGYGDDTSYWYPGGLDLEKIN